MEKLHSFILFILGILGVLVLAVLSTLKDYSVKNLDTGKISSGFFHFLNVTNLSWLFIVMIFIMFLGLGTYLHKIKK